MHFLKANNKAFAKWRKTCFCLFMHNISCDAVIVLNQLGTTGCFYMTFFSSTNFLGSPGTNNALSCVFKLKATGCSLNIVFFSKNCLYLLPLQDWAAIGCTKMVNQSEWLYTRISCEDELFYMQRMGCSELVNNTFLMNTLYLDRDLVILSLTLRWPSRPKWI